MEVEGEGGNLNYGLCIKLYDRKVREEEGKSEEREGVREATKQKQF